MTPEPFIVDPRHRGTLANDAFRGVYAGPPAWKKYRVAVPVLLGVGVVGLVLVGVGFASLRGDGPNFGTGLGLLGLGLVTCAVWQTVLVVRTERRERRLAARGRVVPGRIVSCRGGLDPFEQGQVYYLDVVYHARGPAGEQITGAKSVRRDDLNGQPLPPPGTPVAVVFLDKKAHDVL
jgi:hypothetical protein